MQLVFYQRGCPYALAHVRVIGQGFLILEVAAMPPQTRRSRATRTPAKIGADINRTLYSHDCLDVLNDELALPTGSVDLIYLDPPFNSKNHYNLPFKGNDRDARPVEAFKDTWTWGTKEDDLLRELIDGPQSRHLADIVTLAQRLRVKGELGGAMRRSRHTWLTWRRGYCKCAGYWLIQGQSTFTVTRPPATTLNC